MFRACRSALQLLLAVYIGIGIAIVVAAPPVFRTLGDRDTAGRVFGNILIGTTRVDVILAAGIALLGVACWFGASPGRLRTLTAVLLAILIGTVLYYRYSVMERMLVHRNIFLEGGGMVSAEAAREHREAFDRLHHHYTQVYSGAMLLSLAGFVCASGLKPKRTDAA